MRRPTPRQLLALVAALGPPAIALLWGLAQPEARGSAFALAGKLTGASAIAGLVWLLGHRRLLPAFVARRLVALVIVWIGAATLVFSALRMAPGDPVEAILGEQAPEAARQKLTEALCLDAPWIVQYNDCFWDTVLDGSLGLTFDVQREPVIDRLAEHIPATVELALAGLAVAVILAFPLGLVAALKRATWIDHGATAFALVGVAVPTFWLGPMLLLAFTVGVDWLPNPGQTDRPLAALLLPAITLGTALSAKLTRMIRSSVLEVLHEPFVITARAKGLTELRLLTRHVLRNALIPVITVLGLQFGALLTGAIITEKVFARPGVGTLLLDAIQQRNYPLVQGTVLVIATTYVLVNLVTDLLYALADPRVRLDG